MDNLVDWVGERVSPAGEVGLFHQKAEEQLCRWREALVLGAIDTELVECREVSIDGHRFGISVRDNHRFLRRRGLVRRIRARSLTVCLRR